MTNTLIKYLAPAASGSCLFVMLLFPFKKAVSQRNDYIVTLKNDTVYGVLTYASGRATRLITETKNYPIDVTTVESYFSAEHSSLFRRKKLPGKKKFSLLPCLETGHINLYNNYVNSEANTNIILTYFAEKEKGILVEVWTNRGLFGNSNSSQKEALKILIGDNPVVGDLIIKDHKYGSIDVQFYIHEYNKGPGTP
jgi:hypothetical protein